MEKEKIRVLIVDDSRGDIRIVNEILKDDYITLAAVNGQQALELASKNPKPDIILMDVEMPGMNGYDACLQLKSTPDTSHIDVIFVSAHDTVDEIIAGYDAGGTDYLTKPIDPKELKSKIKITVKNQQNRSKNSDKILTEQRSPPLTSSTEELKIVTDFLRHSLEITKIEELAEMVVSAVDQYDLKNAIQIRSDDRVVNRATNNCVVPLEQELLTRLKGHNQIIEKGQRAIFNFSNISLLVKNIYPDDEKWHRVRKHIAMLLESAMSKYRTVDVNEKFASVILVANQALEELSEKQRAHKEQSQYIVDKMLSNLEESFNSLGLLNSQEEMLLNLIQNGVNESLTHNEKGLEFDNELRQIISQLTAIHQ